MAAARRHLISDNASGVHPDVMAMIQRAGAGHAVAYGEDPLTRQAEALFRHHFGEAARVCLVTTGTAANVLALRAVTDSFEAVICADTAHLHRDECGAPERFLGGKLLVARARGGKIRPSDIEPLLRDTAMVHRAPPRVVSISQCTELGTVYTPDETRALARFCHQHGLLLHVDGARLCNAAASLGLSLREITADLGVDLLSFGGTKNGLLAAEAAVLLGPGLGPHIERHRKQGMQLVSKMRFVAAQFIALLEGDLWLASARQANGMAGLLAREAARVPGVEVVHPVETNAVFARLPAGWIAPLQAHCRFHVWDTDDSIVRWMTSFDTDEQDIHAFAAHLRAVAQGTAPEPDREEEPW